MLCQSVALTPTPTQPSLPTIPMPREESRPCPLTPFLAFLPLPLGNDISAMLQGNMADMSIKQGGWAGLNISLRLVRVIPLGKSDTNPLTILVHMYYIHPRPARHSPLQPKGGTKNPGKPTRPARGLNASAHPNGPRAGPAAQAKAERPPTEDRHLLIPTGSRAPFPDH